MDPSVISTADASLGLRAVAYAVPTPGVGQVVVLTDGDATRPARASEAREYVAAGWPADRWEAAWQPIAQKSLRSMVLRYGDRAVDWMLRDAKVRSSLHAVVQAAWHDDVSFPPRVLPRLDSPGADEDPVQAARARTAREVAEFCARCARRCGLATWGYEATFAAMAYRSSLSEIVLAHETTGPDAGRDILDRIKVKPRACWQLAVDALGNIRYVRGVTEDGDVRLLPIDHFLYFPWMPLQGDISGTSVLDAAYTAWEFKERLWPKYFDYVDQFGSPSIKATTAQGAQPRTVDGRRVTAEQDLLTNLQAFRSNRIIVSPSGTEIEPFEVRGEGGVHISAFDLCDREIVHAIQQAARMTMESEFGSRADSQTAQDVVGLLVRWIKLCCSFVLFAQLFRPLVARNFGEDASWEFTPLPQLGDVEHQDTAQLLNALAASRNAGVTGPEDDHILLDYLGLPHAEEHRPRRVDLPPEIQAVVSALIKARAAALVGPPPGAPGQPPSPGGAPGPPPGNPSQAPPQGGPRVR